MLVIEPLGTRARERLLSLLDSLKCGDPLAPVSVVVPSTYAGLDLRHDLGRHGTANVHFIVLARLAELLGAPSLAAQGRRPLTPLVEAAAVRAVASEARGPLEPVRQHPALNRTLRSTFRELRQSCLRESAMMLLITRSMSASQIATELGYGDLANFSHAFKRWTGRSPSEYRRSQR